MVAQHDAAVRWPPRYAPDRAAVHVRNELDMEASADAVWAWLIRAEFWPTWYANAAHVRFLEGTPPDLSAEARFSWKTFGVTLQSTVLEFVPPERIAWDARRFGIDAYHAWVISATSRGAHVLTEETQHGWLARLGNLLMPGRMRLWHQRWLEQLRDKATRGLPPAP